MLFFPEIFETPVFKICVVVIPISFDCNQQKFIKALILQSSSSHAVSMGERSLPLWKWR